MLRIPCTVLVLAVVVLAPPVAAQYPELKRLSRDDPLFVQLQAGLDEYYRVTGDRTPEERPILPPLALFSYQRRESDDLLSIGARLNLRYDALATLNGADSMAAFNALSRVLVPSLPGLFVCDPPRTALEDMVLAARRSVAPEGIRMVVDRGGRRQTLLFFPGESFSAVERAYFLQILYAFPVACGSVTSRYGMRIDPITGHLGFHSGIDIGAAAGSDVLAARDGTVAEVGWDELLGRYVVVAHPGGWQTLYGHLSSTCVTLGAKVRSGAVLGAVGSSGRATGPHLHFEVRRRDGQVDPGPLLAMENRSRE
jgi:murein DD-endopeptidase MepM/ murein hydrolase activator NlpD